MDDDHNKKPDNDNDKIWLYLGGILCGIILLGFIRLMIVEGPVSAFDKAPGPGLLFIITSIVAWFILSSYLQDNEENKIGKAMWYTGKIVITLFILSLVLSRCGIDFNDSGNIQPVRSL